MALKLILASSSRTRGELLRGTGLLFDIIPSAYEEDMALPLPPRELAVHLSKGKATAVSSIHPEAVVIGADTFVVHEKALIGKPHTPEKARETLSAFRGKTHSVVTGFTVIHGKSGKSVSRSVETLVSFKNISDAEIAAYIATGEPLDKAGAYAIRGMAGSFIEKIEGDPDNVSGLPIRSLLEVLDTFGVSV